MNVKIRKYTMLTLVWVTTIYIVLLFPKIRHRGEFFLEIRHLVYEVITFDEEAITFTGITCLVTIIVLSIYDFKRRNLLRGSMTIFLICFFGLFTRQIVNANNECFVIAPLCGLMLYYTIFWCQGSVGSICKTYKIIITKWKGKKE